MQFADTLTFNAPKLTRDGFLAVRAKAARSGVYQYGASEIGALAHGFKAGDTINVYRPEDEVFSADSVASFLAKPVTNDHPAQPVTADNWQQHARGVNMGALRNGDYLAFDLVIMDSSLISDVQAGKRELSNGYSCTLDWVSGVTDNGEKYDAVQRNIRGNHIAVVDKGRAGHNCRIGDGNNLDQQKQRGGNVFANCDAFPHLISQISMGDKKVSKLMLDGLHVDLTDADAVKAAFDKVKSDAAKAIADSATALTKASDKVATLTAEKLALEKQVSDAKAIDLDKLVADRATLVSKAKAIKADVVIDGKSADEIRKEIVTAQLGDLAADFDAPQIAAAFAVITKDAKADAHKVVSITPLASVSDGAAVINAIRNARYA